MTIGTRSGIVRLLRHLRAAFVQAGRSIVPQDSAAVILGSSEAATARPGRLGFPG